MKAWIWILFFLCVVVGSYQAGHFRGMRAVAVVIDDIVEEHVEAQLRDFWGRYYDIDEKGTYKEIMEEL